MLCTQRAGETRGRRVTLRRKRWRASVDRSGRGVLCVERAGEMGRVGVDGRGCVRRAGGVRGVAAGEAGVVVVVCGNSSGARCEAVKTEVCGGAWLRRKSGGVKCVGEMVGKRKCGGEVEAAKVFR